MDKAVLEAIIKGLEVVGSVLIAIFGGDSKK